MRQRKLLCSFPRRLPPTSEDAEHDLGAGRLWPLGSLVPAVGQRSDLLPFLKQQFGRGVTGRAGRPGDEKFPPSHLRPPLKDDRAIWMLIDILLDVC